MSPRPAMEHIRKPQILAAAAEVITERGLAGTRIADVAERARTSPPAVLYWFGSREGLLTEALSAAEERFYESLTDRLAALAGPSERLRLLFDASAANYDWTLWMELWTRALRDDDARAARQRLDDRWRAEIERQVRDGKSTGEFSGDEPPERVAMILASLLDGLAVQATLGGPSMPAARMRELAPDVAERILGASLMSLNGEQGEREHAVLAGGG